MPTLSSINKLFVGYGLPSMKDEDQIHTGRPFGGIFVLMRKTLNKYCSIVTYDCDRILGLQLTCGSFTALFLCVYLPYDCSDNHDSYMFCLSKIFQIIDEFGPLNVLLIPGWEWSGSSHYLQNALMVMRLTQPLTAKS